MRFLRIKDSFPIRSEGFDDCVFITFDIDWASDEVLADSIDLVEEADVAATWFVTHDTPLLGRLRQNQKFELGIHPNFNYLYNGDARNGATADEVVDRLLAIVPEAKSVRCHTLTQNYNLLELFARKGLTHDCNHFIPHQAGIALKPWYLWNGLIKVPYFWEDDVACMYVENTAIEDLTQRGGMKVLNFHPIHVFLNTENLERYERTRTLHGKSNELVNHRYPGEGTRTAIETLLGLR